MKTNVVMIRNMGQFKVSQRTKDGFFNATDLLQQWNAKDANSRVKKLMNNFLRNNTTEEFIKTIMEKENYQSKDQVYIKTRGKYGGTWMNPYLFIDFAMWLNPSFKYDVIKFIHDQLIEFRHNAGDNYRELACAIQRFQDKINYAVMAKGLNYIAFGKHQKELRQIASSEQLRRLDTLQKNLAFACNTGLINSFEELIAKMRDIYHNKNMY